ncbi:hypothetical protein CAC42_2743 [Sphaceloma murrayae]|uniref:N-acetyltransferase domain-containing protein n=1 Tax=Sphaceloma murrayae TaxID=2082308 RepID=A0A2K1R0I0_9PEZI|nr:hypothetical protein CAC42_2743 [Sphaceloma murrayae]
MFIVASSLRQQGFGAPLFRAALDDILTHDVKYCGLDAVAEQVQTYSRRGFVEAPNGLIKCMTRPFKSTKPDIRTPSHWAARE